MDRREFALGAVAVTAATVTSLSALAAIEHDTIMADILEASIRAGARYLGDEGEFFGRIGVFTQEIEIKMRQWGTYKPLEQMKCVGVDGVARLINLWNNPNVFDECNMMGLGGNGFILSFRTPDQQTIRVTHWCADNSFRWEKVECS